MKQARKQEQLQIRLTHAQKVMLMRAANGANMSLSEWVLCKALPMNLQRFHRLIAMLAHAEKPAYILAEIHDVLQESSLELFETITECPWFASLTPYLENYLAAMIEYTAHKHGVPAPLWLKKIDPLKTPVFASELMSLRLHLLLHSPPPYRNRNIFIDAPIGKRV